MANEEEKELESIIRETDTPSRTDDKDKKKKRVAKLTGRTYASLKNKIKEKKLNKAVEKYNKKYADMRRALKEANSMKTAQASGEDISDSEIVAAYDVVNSYSKKLAKLGAKLLEDDIKRLVADKKPKPIRAPRFLVGKMRKLVKAVGKVRDSKKGKKLQKELAKDIKKTTQEYIQGSLESAVFKDATTGELNEQIDKNVIKNLKLDNSAESFEDKIANLRKFISTDGNTPALSDEEIKKEENNAPNVPPLAPTSDVKKEDTNVSEAELLSGINNKSNSGEEEIGKGKDDTSSSHQRRVTIDDLTKSLNKGPSTVTPAKTQDKEDNPKTVETQAVEQKKDDSRVESKPVELSSEDKHLVNKRKREVAQILSLGKDIETLQKQASKTSDPETKELIAGYIEGLKNELENIVANGPVKDRVVENSENEKSKDITSDNAEGKLTQIFSNAVDKASEQDTGAVSAGSLDPITVEAKESKTGESGQDLTSQEGDRIVQWADGSITHEKDEPDSMKNVEVTDTGLMRATQVAAPSAVRVTPQDIKNMEERNKNAQLRIESLRQQRVDLENQRKMLQEYIDVAKNTRDAELQAQEMAQSNATLAGEVAELSSQAAAINSSLGRSK